MILQIGSQPSTCSGILVILTVCTTWNRKIYDIFFLYLYILLFVTVPQAKHFTRSLNINSTLILEKNSFKISFLRKKMH